jgi:hypothetical protein
MFDEIKIRGTSWQIKELAISLFNNNSNPERFMKGNVVYDDNLSRS